MIKSAILCSLIAAIVGAGLTTAAGQTPIVITVGATGSTGDAPIYLAAKKGFFNEEGLDVKVIGFRSAADMVAPLGLGQLDVGGGSASAGLYNAMLQGISIKIVADKGASRPGYGGAKILVRRDHVDSGRYKTLTDLKGMKFAMNAPGVSNTALLNALLKSVGLKYSDVETINLPLPDHVAALGNKGVDASASVEPAATAAIQLGFAVLVKRDDEVIPNHQLSVLLYSDKFAKNFDVAHRFMRAFVRGVRFYNGALEGGHLAGPNADEVIQVLTESTPTKDPAVYKAITPTGINPDGKVNVQSLADDAAFYKSQGLITGDIRVEDMIDSSFVEAAVKELGPYQK